MIDKRPHRILLISNSSLNWLMKPNQLENTAKVYCSCSIMPRVVRLEL